MLFIVRSVERTDTIAKSLFKVDTMDRSVLNIEAIAHEGNLDKQGRVFSSYKVGKSTLYIITEWNRETTTLLLSSDY